MTAASIKGRYLFGVDAATSIVPQAGANGNLVATTGTGGFTYGSNYVDCKTGSYFSSPFNTTPRDRTIIIAGVCPRFEQCFDGDSVNRFPPTVKPAVAMAAPGDAIWTDTLAYDWLGDGPTGVSAFRSGNGDGDAAAGTYDVLNPMVAYRDGTFSWSPYILIAGHGSTPASVYLGSQSGRNLGWFAGNAASYAAALGGTSTSKIGHVTPSGPAGTTATAHAILCGYAEYGYLTKAQAIAEASDMVTLLEARGWAGVFHNPVTSE